MLVELDVRSSNTLEVIALYPLVHRRTSCLSILDT